MFSQVHGGVHGSGACVAGGGVRGMHAPCQILRDTVNESASGVVSSSDWEVSGLSLAFYLC